MRWLRGPGRGIAVLALWAAASVSLAQEQEEAPLPIGDTAARVIERMGSGSQQGLDTRISVNVRDMELTSAVRLLAEEAGINLAMGKDVDGKVTCSLRDVTARVGGRFSRDAFLGPDQLIHEFRLDDPRAQ